MHAKTETGLVTDNLTLVNHDALERLLNFWLFRTGIALHIYLRIILISYLMKCLLFFERSRKTECATEVNMYIHYQVCLLPADNNNTSIYKYKKLHMLSASQ